MNKIIIIIINLVSILLLVAFYTLAERKVMASMQRRIGPGFYSRFFGVFQGLIDGFQLFITGILIPVKAFKKLFILSPIILFTLSVTAWIFLPIQPDNAILVDDFSLLFTLAIVALSSLPLLLAGVASRSKLAYFGSLRAIVSVLSYDLIIGLIFLIIGLIVGSFDILAVIEFQSKYGWLIYYIPMIAVIFIILSLVETNRAPFDLAESESELVAGFHVEYSGFLFALFFLAEYSFMLLAANLFVILFLGAWLTPFNNISLVGYMLKVLFINFLFIVIRAVFPRVRIDQLIIFCWKILLCFILLYFLLIILFFILLPAYTLFNFMVFLAHMYVVAEIFRLRDVGNTRHLERLAEEAKKKEKEMPARKAAGYYIEKNELPDIKPIEC
jgi:NADH-quinone oxidoreductase subunit H